MNNYNDVTEQIFDAVSVIASKKIESLGFDKTVLCSIEDVSNAKEGEYRVKTSDEQATFLAYSENTEYPLGSQVYVKIPNNNYSEQKLIIGKYSAAAGKRVLNPFSKIAYKDSDVSNRNINISLNANGSNQKSNPFSLNITRDDKIYDTIGVKAVLKTSIAENIIEGTYGIKVLFKKDEEVVSEIEMDSSYIEGVYKYYTNQNVVIEDIFDIKNTEDYDDIEVILFQNNDFIQQDENNTQIHFSPNNSEDIFLSDISLTFGYLIENYNDNNLKLYSLEGDRYQGEEERTLKTVFIYFDKNNNRYIPCYTYSEMAALMESYNLNIKWYKQGVETLSQIENDHPGLSWIYLNKESSDRYIDLGVQYLASPGADNINAIYKVVYEFSNSENKNKKVYSKEITLLNRTTNSYSKIDLDIENNGRFFIYSDVSRKSKYLNSAIIFNFTATLDLGADKNPFIELEGENSQVLYDFSKEQSMIENVSTISKIGNKIEGTISLKPEFQPSLFNNDFLISIIYNEITYTTKVSLQIGYSGSQGTSYRFEIVPRENGIVYNLAGSETSWNVRIIDISTGKYVNDDVAISANWYSPEEGVERSNGLSFVFSNRILTVKTGDSGFGFLSSSEDVKNNYNVIQLSADIGNLKLREYLPIPCADIEVKKFSGVGKVLYNLQGQLEEVSSSPIQINDDENSEASIFNKNNWENDFTIVDNKYLKVPLEFKSNDNLYIIQCQYLGEPNSRKKCFIPLLIENSPYTNPYINAWSGNGVVIDNEKGYILSNVVAAGIKNSDNSFSGIKLGDVCTLDCGPSVSSVIASTADSMDRRLGLYGYNSNAITFGLKVDGTGFIGGGKGQILFDGNKSVITSGDWKEDNLEESTGLYLDIDDGKIYAKSSANDSKSYVAITPDSTGALFQINSNEGKTLFQVDNNIIRDEKTKKVVTGEYFLQSDNYVTGVSGFKIDLLNGIIENNGVIKGLQITGTNDRVLTLSEFSLNTLIKISTATAATDTIKTTSFKIPSYTLNTDNSGLISGYSIDTSKSSITAVYKGSKKDSDPFLISDLANIEFTLTGLSSTPIKIGLSENQSEDYHAISSDSPKTFVTSFKGVTNIDFETTNFIAYT